VRLPEFPAGPIDKSGAIHHIYDISGKSGAEGERDFPSLWLDGSQELN
jgi:hypothetical protein